MNNSKLAMRSEVPFGEKQIEGYLLPEPLWTQTNKFGVSKTQAVILAYPGYNRNQAPKRFIQIVKSKQAQTLTNQGFLVHPKIKVSQVNERVDLLAVDYLPAFLKVCSKLGCDNATELLLDLAGLSLQQIFADAFKIKFEQEERQDWIKDRLEGKQVRHSLTDAIKWYLTANADILSNGYINFVYSNCSDLVNLGLFGRKSKRLCIDLKVSSSLKLRDALTADELRWLSEIEDLAARLIMHQEYEPMDAIKEAISRVAIPTVFRTA